MAMFLPDGDRFVPTGASRGPWDPNALNGGPVAALVARAAERHLDEGAPILPGHLLARLTVDLLRPVPMAPLDVRSRTLRGGRKIQLVEVLVEADGVLVTRATALRMPAAAPEGATAEDPPPGHPDDGDVVGGAPRGDLEHFHSHGAEVRHVPPPEGRPGPFLIWVRLQHDLVEGEPTSPVCLAAAAADLGSGLSGNRKAGWRSINVDINLHLHRPPEGPWVCFAATSDNGAGVGQASGPMYDERGRIGNVTETVLVEPYTRPVAGQG